MLQTTTSSDRGSQAFVISSTSAVFHFLTMPQIPVRIRTSIDWTSLRAARQKCARLAADDHLDEAAKHISIAKDIMDKAQSYNVKSPSFSVDAQVKVAKFLQTVLESATPGSRGSSYVASAPGPLVRPSKAPRLS